MSGLLYRQRVQHVNCTLLSQVGSNRRISLTGPMLMQWVNLSSAFTCCRHSEAAQDRSHPLCTRSYLHTINWKFSQTVPQAEFLYRTCQSQVAFSFSEYTVKSPISHSDNNVVAQCDPLP